MLTITPQEPLDKLNDTLTCSRNSADYLRMCFTGICKNGGRVVYTYSTCSCDCIGTGFADWDCSERPENLVGASPIISPDDPCKCSYLFRDVSVSCMV